MFVPRLMSRLKIKAIALWLETTISARSMFNPLECKGNKCVSKTHIDKRGVQ